MTATATEVLLVRHRVPKLALLWEAGRLNLHPLALQSKHLCEHCGPRVGPQEQEAADPLLASASDASVLHWTQELPHLHPILLNMPDQD